MHRIQQLSGVGASPVRKLDCCKTSLALYRVPHYVVGRQLVSPLLARYVKLAGMCSYCNPTLLIDRFAVERTSKSGRNGRICGETLFIDNVGINNTWKRSPGDVSEDGRWERGRVGDSSDNKPSGSGQGTRETPLGASQEFRRRLLRGVQCGRPRDAASVADLAPTRTDGPRANRRRVRV